MKKSTSSSRTRSGNFSGKGSGENSSKASSGSSRISSPRNELVRNYEATSYLSPTMVELEDNSKYLRLLNIFCKNKYSFMKHGSRCYIHKRGVGGSVDPLFSFPYNKDDLRNACFLFSNEKNNFEMMLMEKTFKFVDCSTMYSPSDFQKS